MPIIYSVDEANDAGPGYFRRKKDAFAAARDLSTLAAAEEGDRRPIRVSKDVLRKLDLDVFISALNRAGWSDSTEVIATFVAGRQQ